MRRKYREENKGEDGSSGSTGGAPPSTPGDTPPPNPPGFTSTLGEGLRNNPSLKDFKDVDALATSYINLKQFQGTSIRIPGEDASDDARKEFNDKLANVDGVMLRPDFNNDEQSAEFFQSLGAPKEKTGYEYSVPEDAKNFQVNEGKIEMFREMALKEGLTKKQFSNLMKGVVAADIADAQKAVDTQGQNKVALKQEWGMAYEENMTMATNVAAATGAPEAIVAAMQDGNAGPEFVKWMYSLTKKLGSEGMNLMDRQQQKVNDTPDEIRAKISEIMDNKEHAYWKAGHPDHARALEKMIELQQKLSPQ